MNTTETSTDGGTTSKVEFVDATPDYAAMFEGFCGEILPTTEALLRELRSMTRDGRTHRINVDEIREEAVLQKLNTLTSAISIALQSATTPAEFASLKRLVIDANAKVNVRFREVVHA